MKSKIVIIGAGIGGLASAVELARNGQDVTVLEAHVDPGGCAATFYHQGYRFDAGATLAGGFATGAPLAMLGERFEIDWQAHPDEIAMQVHLPDGASITRWSDPAQWQVERLSWFGAQAEAFWRWQERTADVLWQLARRLPAWPPQTPAELARLALTGSRWFMDDKSFPLTMAADAWRPAATHLQQVSPRLHLFADAQLLISAQATSKTANALYAAAALDLPRQGVAHLPGGIGSIARQLAESLLRAGGQIHYRQEVQAVSPVHRGGFLVITQKGKTYLADEVIFNTTPWNARTLLDKAAPPRLKRLPPQPRDGWGAFVIYAGLESTRLPADLPLHHQLITGESLGEGNSVFLSISPAWDGSRAPAGQRAITLSTHTALAPWWHLYATDRQAYEQRKEEYTQRLLTAAEQLIPTFRQSAAMVLPGTPVTFQRFTRRAWGWVGGFPQTNLLRAWGPRLADHLWLVGDSIFPGQSIPAAALGGLRVANSVLAATSKSRWAVAAARARRSNLDMRVAGGKDV
jgi:C-3',4' desaturase CrtD